jgi:hypothetical protein
MIVQTVAVTGIFMTLGGVVVSLIGRLVRLSGLIIDLIGKFTLFALVHPWITAIAVSVSILIVIFLKFRDVAVPVLNAVEIGAQMVYIGFVKLIKYLLWGFDKLALGLEKFYEVLAKLPGKLGEPYREAAENIKRFRGNLQDLIKASDVEMERVGNKISNILGTGEGSLAKGYNKAKNAIDNFINVLKKLGKDVKIEEVKQKFDAIKTIGEDTARALGSVFKHFFSDVFRGQVEDVKDYFREFGNMVLDILAEVLAKMVLVKTIGAIFPSMIPFFHQGGVVCKTVPVRAHSGLRADEMPIIVQSGEGVLSKRAMSTLGRGNFDALNRGEKVSGGNVNITIAPVIQAWDMQDIYRNRETIIGIMNEAIRNNTTLRKVIKDYA